MTQIEIQFNTHREIQKNDQQPLGTPAYMLVRASDPSTSKQAARDISEKTPALEQLVLDTIRSFGSGCISDEVRARLSDLPYSSVTARFSALLRKGRIVETGEKRRGASGKHQRVLMAV